MLAFANIDHAGKRWRDSDSSGQSLVEVAVIVPILFLLIAYAVDYGYFFLVAAQLASASRVAAEYSIQGFQGPAQTQLPVAGPISTTASVAAPPLRALPPQPQFPHPTPGLVSSPTPRLDAHPPTSALS